MSLAVAALALALGCPLTSALAQDAEETFIDETPLREPVLITGGWAYQGEADIDGGGTMQVNRFDVGVAGRLDLMDRLRWSNTLFFAANDYEFDGGGFSRGNPWGTVLTTRLVSDLHYAIDQNWGVFGGGVFIFSPETGASWGDSFTGGGLLGFSYRHSDTLSLGVGVAVITQIEDDVRVTPQVKLNWVPHEKWAVRVGAVPVSGGAAAAGEVAYRVADPVEVALGLLYNQRRFRLDDSGPAPDGVGEDNTLPLRLRVGWNITPKISLHALAGAALAGELVLDDRNGNQIRSENYDPAAYLGLRFMGAF